MVLPRQELACDLHIRGMDRALGEETSNCTRAGEWNIARITAPLIRHMSLLDLWLVAYLEE
jgi:hypothetical protein